MSRKRRDLSADDRRLWDLVRRTAEPLRGRLAPGLSAGEAAADTGWEERQTPTPPAPSDGKPSEPARPSAPTRFDQRMRSRLSRGRIDIDARLDLHGLTQNAAHQRLRRFLEAAQADGTRLVLVITGKGGLGERVDYGAPERGVLRRAVPQWLESAAFRHLVSGYDQAGRRHGGAGAIYVRIRRRRDRDG